MHVMYHTSRKFQTKHIFKCACKIKKNTYHTEYCIVLACTCTSVRNLCICECVHIRPFCICIGYICRSFCVGLRALKKKHAKKAIVSSRFLHSLVSYQGNKHPVTSIIVGACEYTHHGNAICSSSCIYCLHVSASL